VALRLSLGGHSILEAHIRRRWPAVHANLTWFAAEADALTIFSDINPEKPPTLAGRAEQARLLHLN